MSFTWLLAKCAADFFEEPKKAGDHPQCSILRSCRTAPILRKQHCDTLFSFSLSVALMSSLSRLGQSGLGTPSSSELLRITRAAERG